MGWSVSEIGFGAWAIGSGWGSQKEEDSFAALHKAFDLGVNFIDTALGYGNGRSERIIARFLKERGAQAYITTKIPPAPGPWPPTPYCNIEERFPESSLREQLEQSLKNLNCDCVDVVLLHTWTRAWNRQPTALEVMRRLQQEGKVKAIGISTPEHDQNALIDLMRQGWLDAVEVIYNIFEQEPAAEFLPVAREHQVGVICRMPFDEGVLTGKFTRETTFPPDDFRSRYFRGNRLADAIERVEKIRETIGQAEPDLPTAALKFCLKHPAVSTVIPGIRNASQAHANCSVADQPPMSDALELKLRAHAWRKAFWYSE